jgi:phosphoribosylpyrophosphate synthetase
MTAILLNCPQMEQLAGRVARIGSMRRGQIRWDVFRDGFPDMKIQEVETIRNRDVAFLASLDAPGEIFRQLSILYEIPRYAVRSFRVVLPYFPTGTMERVEEPGQIATAATLARMLSAIPMSMSGPAQIIIFDIHALQELFYFSDAVLPRLESAVPRLKTRLRGEENVAIAFPDEGAWKRFGKYFQDYPIIVCQKVRNGGARTVRIRDGEPEGKHVVIVDDLVMSGATLLESRNVLMAGGARATSCYVTHAAFPGNSWRHFLDAGLERFWITDSCPAAATLHGRGPFEVLSLDEDIARMLAET